MEGLSRIVKGYRDRIQRGGGSVVVNADGTVVLDAPVGKPIQFQKHLKPYANNVVDLGDSSLAWRNAFIAGTLTVSGTGTHKFGGPIQSDAAGTVIAGLQANTTSPTNVGLILAGKRQDSSRFIAVLESNNDVTFKSSTDGSTYTEALRIVNANGYVSVAARLGIKVANPGRELEVAGDGYLTGTLVLGTSNGISAQATVRSLVGTRPGLHVEQPNSGATTPVLVVKGGATPGAGGDLQQWQDNTGAVKASVSSSGSAIFPAVLVAYMYLSGGSNVMEISSRGSAPGAPSAGVIRLWYDDATKAFKYIDSTGTTRTLQAA